MIQLNYRDSKPIYEQIKDGLKKLIITGSMLPNDKLPSVREFASGLAINPNTIQRAYRELESEGFIYSIAGKGSFVAEDALRNGQSVRKNEAMAQFDEIVEELFLLSVDEETIVERVRSDYASMQTKGGKSL